MSEFTSQQPDLDWSQVRETIRMINLAVAQIEMSMKEGHDSVGTLTKAFTVMADKVQTIERHASENSAVATEPSQKIIEECEAVASEMQHAIIAFQFYDKLTQRLSNVSQTMGSLTDLVGDNSRLYNPMEWSKLQEQIKSKYTMPAEHEMFEMIMKGMAIEDILKLAPAAPETEDDIELF